MKMNVRTAGLLAAFLFSTTMAGATTSGDDPHAHHRAAMKKTTYQVSDARYEVPDVQLLDDAGASVTLQELLGSGEPIALNFIFTTCTTISMIPPNLIVMEPITVLPSHPE